MTARARDAEVKRAVVSDDGERLVPLHRGFDELIVAGLQGWQRFGIDQYLDAPGHAGLASDQPAAFEREHHLVD